MNKTLVNFWETLGRLPSLIFLEELQKKFPNNNPERFLEESIPSGIDGRNQQKFLKKKFGGIPVRNDSLKESLE